jgi:TM2 domain-containing membrane protein YozV
MNQSKNWYESKTIWGVIISLIGWVASEYFKIPVNVTTTDAAAGETVAQIIQLAGLVIAVIGRVKSTTTINLD